MDVQKIIVNNLENDIEHPIETVDSSQIDLSFSDENGFDICNISNGHIITKEFNSKFVSETVDNNVNTIDFSISDENNNNIVSFENGHIKTKNFNSEYVSPQ